MQQAANYTAIMIIS